MYYLKPPPLLILFLIACLSASAQVKIIRPAAKEPAGIYYSSFNNQIVCTGISNHGNMVAAGYADGSIDVWKADGTLLATLTHCYPESFSYHSSSIYISEEDNWVGWSSSSAKSWDDENVTYFFCWRKFSGKDTLTHQTALADDVYSVDYDVHNKKWLIGTGTHSSIGKLTNPGIYWIDAHQQTIHKEWHVNKQYSMQAKFAPGAAYILAMGQEYYSQDTIHPIYKYSGKNYALTTINHSIKGYSPQFFPMPDGAYVVSTTNPTLLWHIQSNGDKKMIKQEEYEAVENVYYDTTRKACTVLFRRHDNSEYEWVQFDEDWQVLDKKMLSTTNAVLYSAYQPQRAVTVSATDSVLFVNTTYLPVPKPKLFLQLQTGHAQSIDEVIMHPGLPLAASYSKGEGKIKIWDLQTGFQLDDIKTGYAEDLQFVPVTNQLAWRESNKIVFYDFKTRSISNAFTYDDLNYMPYSFSISPDAKTIEIISSRLHLLCSAVDGTIIKQTAAGYDFTQFQLLNNEGAKVFYTYNSEGDSIGYISAAGKITALAFPEIRRWWLKRDKTEIAVLLSKNGRLHNTKLLILELPSFKTKKEIPLTLSETVAPDPTFTKLVTASDDTLFIRGIDDKTKGSYYYLKGEYFNSLDPLDWDMTGQYVIRTDYTNNRIRLFRNYWRNLGEEILMPVFIRTDPVSRQLIVGAQKGLWAVPLNYLKKASLIDSNALYFESASTVIAPSGETVLYSAEFPPSDYGKTFLASLAGGNKETVSAIALEQQVYHPSLNWLAGTTRNGYIHLLKLDKQVKALEHDSLPGSRPVFAKNKPYIAYLAKDSSTIIVFDFEKKLIADTFLLHRKEDYPSLGAGFCFVNNDKQLIWSGSNQKMIYTINDHPSSRHIYTNYDISTLLASSDTTGFFAGDVAGNILYINTTTGKTTKIFYGHTEAVTSLALYENHLYSAAKDGTIKIWDADSALLKITMVLDRDGQVLLIDNEKNYYASSRRDPKTMAFVYKGKVLPFEQFDLFANRPDEVMTGSGMADASYISSIQEAVGKRLRRAGKAQNVFQTNLPIVTVSGLNELPLLVRKRELTVKITATDSLSAVRAMHIFINGVPLYGTKGLVLPKPVKRYTANLNLPLSAGRNRVELVAENEVQVQSAKAIFQIEYEPAAAVSSKIYYIGVGVSRYADSASNLTYAAKDIRDVATAFGKKYPDAVIDTLTDENATRENILQLKKLLQKTSVDDKVIISFSGHGLLDKQKDFYFGTHNINFKTPQKEGWSFADMQWLLDSIPARNKLLLVDACHSGEVDKYEPVTPFKNDSVISTGARSSIVGDEPVVGLQNSFALMQELFSDLSSSNGTVMITAAGGRQYALEGKQWNNGVFTYALLRGLVELKADTNGDGSVTVSELRDYLFSEVQRLTNGRQQPTTRTENLVNDWKVW